MLTAPTASGKTALSLEVAALAGQAGRTVEIVSADAFLVYRGLDIGTAKPTQNERAAVPHHLIDVVDVDDGYDVARYVRDAETAVAGILERGNLPLVVGGTGFYLSALLRGLPLTPPSNPQQRGQIEAELQERGLDALLSDIHAHSPAEVQRMERNPRRVVRALEVFRQTGRWPGEFGQTAPAFRYSVLAFALPEAEVLPRIAARTAQMFAQGWVQEASWLAERISPETLPRPTVWQALGYAQALAVARGTLPEDVAYAQVEAATRQYVRRQLTWIRRQLGAEVQSPQQAAQTLTRLLAIYPPHQQL
ncbi:tRNA (adenosine(37)-N6)-dimethylallyltransferase MiaA [Deinococcus ruber]|nr:tRNA (adenosine(37)-N6)-dimethylallyltransferase MiaA [Deinococcus ruber]